MRRILALTALLTYVITCSSSQASEIEEVLPNGMLAVAEYSQGDTNKPAILLLHGFLTVHTFNLISNIASEMADNHYSILAPTLTLGISKRKSTLDCSALHLHNMESDLGEIEWWVNWLIKKGHKKIILMGHSSGSVELVNYINQYKHPEVVKFIGLSIIPLGDKNNSHFVISVRKATRLLASKNNDIQTFTLGYCIDNYSAPATEFMSYGEWNSDRILKTLRSIKIHKKIIMGSDDIPVYPDWIKDLGNTGSTIEVIKGADHFFGNGTEFELYDSISQGLKDS
jgi:pimeloyl-ACP methyl ester carboxylesterase